MLSKTLHSIKRSTTISQATRLAGFSTIQKQSYDEHYRRSLDPKTREAFWAEAMDGIKWFKPWDRVLDDS